MNPLQILKFASTFKTRLGFIAQFLAVVAHCQLITLSEYFPNSQCSNVFVSEGDRVIFNSTVDVTRSPDTGVVINYDIKRQHQLRFEHLCYLAIPDECIDNSNYYCSCRMLSTSGMYQVNINMPAHKVNSQAHIRGELVYRQTSFYSEVRTLPTIYDLQSDLLNVYINDQLIDPKNCTTATNESSAILVAKCFDDCPCRIELIDSDTNQTLKYGHNIVSYETEPEMNMKLRFEVCKKLKTVQCVITKVSVKTNDQSEETNLLFLLILLLLLVFAIIAIIKRHFLNTVLQAILNKTFEQNKELDIENSALLSDNLDPFHDSIKMDIPKANTVCDIHVNPQHGNIISFNMFTESDLPVLYRDNVLFQYIQAVSNLTGKITYLMDFKDNNNINNDMNETDGLITDIDIFENGYNMFRRKHKEFNCCPCNSCQKSSSPSKKWAEIFISTSKSNLIKNTAGKYIDITMYMEHLNLTMEGNFQIISDDQSEIRQMKFVTCDQNILDNVSEIKRIWDESIKSSVIVNEHFRMSREMDQIYISVSYLQSHTRYISIGQYTQTYLDYITGSEIMYAPSLHPRSSGSPVILTGYSDRSGFYFIERNAIGVCFKFNTGDVVLK